MNLVNHLIKQQAFSDKTFGPGMRTQGISDHIKKELGEVANAPDDIEEWIDLVLLSLDGAWRCFEKSSEFDGLSPEKRRKAVATIICNTLEWKQANNENRDWPDYRKSDPNKAIEHVRS